MDDASLDELYQKFVRFYRDADTALDRDREILSEQEFFCYMQDREVREAMEEVLAQTFEESARQLG